MKSISKLKDEARKYEQREEWEKAIQAYLQVLKVADEEEAEVELPLYNRLGDLCVRLGRPEEAVRHYEQAADRYAEAGLYNNAIALCNKALRYNRDRLELVRKLGQFSALQGFITDARRYFLDYAERQFNAGRIDDALSALEDFANVSDDADVREMLGRRMAAHGRIGDALNELQRAYEMRVRDGDTQKADALRAEIDALDPARSRRTHAEPQAPAHEPAESLPGLDEPTASIPDLPAHDEPETFEVASFDDPGPATVEGLETTDADTGFDAGRIEITGFEQDAADSAIVSESVEGLETSSIDFGAVDAPSEDMGLIRDESSFGDMFPEEQPAGDFDLPLLGDDEAAVPAPPQIENVHTPIDLGTDFTFDLTGFGSAAPAAEVPAEPVLEGPIARGGADDDGIDLPTVDDFSDAGLPTLDDDVEGVELPTMDYGGEGFDLPLLGDDDEAAPLPTLNADDDGISLPTLGDEDDVFELPTFDGDSATDAAPPAWQQETPSFEVPAFETDTPSFEDLPGETEEPDTAFDVPTWESPLDLPELEAPGTKQPDVGPHDAPSDRQVPESAEAHTPVEIPAIELPTWDTEPAVSAEPEPVERALEPDTLEDLPGDVPAPRVFAEEPSPEIDEPVTLPEAGDAVEGQAITPVGASDDWLAELTAEADTAVEEELGEPEAQLPADVVLPAIEDVKAAETQSRAARKEMTSRPVPVDDDGFVDLGALVTEDDEDEGTRFRIQETAPTGDEDRDFAELLNQFKSKVHEHLPAEDAVAHYDLGLAFKEMGLIDEAIGEFQVSLRAGHMRLRVYEELGQCFLMKEQYNIAEKVLTRALEMKFEDELELLGVYYHLGRAYEALGRRDQARDAYERVLGMDIGFEDVTARLARL